MHKTKAQQWEYEIFSSYGYINLDLKKVLNSKGEKGWELVSFYKTDFIFKRPKQEAVSGSDLETLETIP